MSDTTPAGRAAGSPPRAFWIGLPLMLAFAVAGLGGGAWALDRILLERALEDHGALARGTVIRRTMIHANTSARASEGTAYELTYRFDSADGVQLVSTSRVGAERYFSARKGEPIRVRYLPEQPTRSLPEGAHQPGLYWLFAILGLGIGLGATVAALGMIVQRVRGT